MALRVLFRSRPLVRLLSVRHLASVPKPTRFVPLFKMPLDTVPLASRLSALSLAASPAPTGTALNTYFFRPKSGSKHPSNDQLELTLVVVAVEQGKDVGSAATVAKKVGIKDMRAIAGDMVADLIGRKREEGQSTFPLFP